MKEHRYARIARDLAARISSGKLAVGQPLPTEAALCKTYGVSRYTAREALRRLREAGLIRRRPRAGTTVAARGTGTAFSLPVSSAADLLRYASDARFHIEKRGKLRKWLRLDGVRRRPGAKTPLCLVSVYLASPLAALAKRLPSPTGVIYPQVEKALGARIAWVDQRIEAVPLGRAEAARLGVAPGACGLRVRRYYYDASERLLEVSDSLHAGAHFAYEMRLRRD